MATIQESFSVEDSLTTDAPKLIFTFPATAKAYRVELSGGIGVPGVADITLINILSAFDGDGTTLTKIGDDVGALSIYNTGLPKAYTQVNIATNAIEVYAQRVPGVLMSLDFKILIRTRI